MRAVVWLIVLCAAAVVAATTLGTNDGLVTVYFSRWRIELSLNFFLLLVIGGSIGVSVAVRAADALVTLPTRAREWRALQRERAIFRGLQESLGEYFAARYSRAHRAAQRALTLQQETPVLSDDANLRHLLTLLAAASLHRLQDRPRRDEALQQLSDPTGKAVARPMVEGAGLLAAEWALDDREPERALELLAALPPGVGRRTQALRHRLLASRLARRPQEALDTARLLAKHQAFSVDAARSLLRSLAITLLDEANDIEQLKRQWQGLESQDRADPVVATRAARRAADLGAVEDARAWLQPLWDRLHELPAQDRTAVALTLAAATKGIGNDWLPRAEKALATLSSDVAVVAACAMVLAERRLWGKARRPLEQSAQAPTLDTRARRRAWRTLAFLAREEGDESRAAACDREAAALD